MEQTLEQTLESFSTAPSKTPFLPRRFGKKKPSRNGYFLPTKEETLEELSEQSSSIKSELWKIRRQRRSTS
jgi:hypothetical protein